MKSHPRSRLCVTYKSKDVNGTKVSKVDGRSMVGSSLIGRVEGINTKDIMKVFGVPNRTTKEYGREWSVRVGPNLMTIYNGQKRGGGWQWNIGGFNTGQEIDALKKVLPEIKVSE